MKKKNSIARHEKFSTFSETEKKIQEENKSRQREKKDH